MSSFPLIVNLLVILSILNGLSTLISCENVNSIVIDNIESKLLTKSNQSTLIKLGFSGIFWNYIKSNRNQLNNLSPQCLSKLKYLSDSIESGDPEALKLFSLSSHLPNKMFEISYSDLEGYDQCLSLQSTHYCQASVLPIDNNLYPHWFSLRYNTTIHIGYCLPNVCSPNEVDYLITSVVQSHDWQKIHFHGCQIPSTFLERLSKSNASQFGSFVLLSGIICVVIISSIMDYFGFFYKVNGLTWLRYFAFQQTHRNLIDYQAGDRIILIDYFRILISFIYHIIHFFALTPISNLLYITESLDVARQVVVQWAFQPCNSDWIYGGLIYLGATSVATNLWMTVKTDTTLTTYVWMLIKKLILYWPIIIVCIALKIVLPLLGSGPVYTYHTQWRSDVCASNWWYTLLHIHNYQKAFDMCNATFWSMDAELHLFTLALILVYLYKTRPRMAYIINGIMVIIGLGIIFNTYYSNKLVYRLVGHKFEQWEQIEDSFAKTYLRSESHLFTYSLALMITFHCAMNISPSLGLSKTISRLITFTLTTLVIIAAYSPGLWNVLRIETTPFWYALHATTCKAVIAIGFAWIGWLAYHDERVYKTITKSRVKLDKNQNPINNKSNDKSNQSTSIGYKLLYAASRATFFSHWSLYVWFHAKKAKVYLDYRCFVDLSFLIVLGYFCGLVFHFFVLGPFENIIISLRLKKPVKSVKSD